MANRYLDVNSELGNKALVDHQNTLYDKITVNQLKWINDPGAPTTLSSGGPHRRYKLPKKHSLLKARVWLVRSVSGLGNLAVSATPRSSSPPITRTCQRQLDRLRGGPSMPRICQERTASGNTRSEISRRKRLRVQPRVWARPPLSPYSSRGQMKRSSTPPSANRNRQWRAVS